MMPQMPRFGRYPILIEPCVDPGEATITTEAWITAQVFRKSMPANMQTARQTSYGFRHTLTEIRNLPVCTVTGDHWN